jgi:hypothetical protein
LHLQMQNPWLLRAKCITWQNSYLNLPSGPSLVFIAVYMIKSYRNMCVYLVLYNLGICSYTLCNVCGLGFGGCKQQKQTLDNLY